MQAQAAKLEQVIFAGFTHDPAEKLGRGLLRMVGAAFEGAGGLPLEFVFYSDSGSTAIEAALKMAIGAFAHKGEKRTKILALDGGYHGDTFGAMAAGGRSVFNAAYEPYLFEVEHLPFPEAGQEKKTLAALRTFLQRHGSQTAAFVFEPLVQGASGMRFYSPDLLRHMAGLCREYGVLLIADEVMTGFGRTGSLFACVRSGFIPDLMCLSKGLTGGFLPMGATLATRDIYKAFYHDEKAKMFFHSTSFTGNALACAAALASLQIWEEEPVLEDVARIEASHSRAAGWFSARPDVENVRVMGSIFALDIKGADNGYLAPVGAQIYDYMMAHGVLLRPMGDCVYILPPYCIEEADLEYIYATLWAALDSLRGDVEQRAA